MRTCIAVCDAADDKFLAFIDATEMHAHLLAESKRLEGRGKLPANSGKEDAPYVIDSFVTILGYIDARNNNKSGRMWFKFFGVDFYQNGNKTADEKDFYIGLKGDDTLSYPKMRLKLNTPHVGPPIKSAEVKAATGVAASNRHELLAIACLFIAEGRRDLTSLVTHLLLCDLISDQVKYGSGGAKTRSLASAVDKKKNFENNYAGATAAGDSPMSQKGAVANAKVSHEEVQGNRTPQGNRYYDKTNSLLAQWFAAKYSNPNCTLLACRPTDEAMLRAVEEKKQAFLDDKIENPQKKNREKLWQAKERARKQWEPKVAGLKAQVLAELAAMLKLKIDTVVGGQATGFVYESQQKVDTKVLREVLV